MPRESVIEVKQYGITRCYRVWYSDDSPDRAEAVAFFQTVGDIPWLSHDFDFLDVLDALPIEEANEHLRRHPVPEGYDCLVVWDGDLIRDADLARIEHLPELKIVRLHSDHITDAGVRHLRHLRRVEWLELYSARVTDACLDVIRGLRTLRSLDLQLSRGISRQKCKALVKEMGIRDSYLPWGAVEPIVPPDRRPPTR